MKLSFWFGRSDSAKSEGRNRSHRSRSGAKNGEESSAGSDSSPVVLDDRILRLRQNDEDTFASIFREYASGLLTFAWRKVDSRAIAEEIVQDVFFDIWERRMSLQPEILLRAYLYQAVRYRVRNQYRSNKVERRYEERMATEAINNEIAVASENTDDLVKEIELREVIAASIKLLPPRSREVFLLNRQHNLSYMEIAKTLGISVKTVEVHMGRALAALRQCMADWVK